MSRSIRRRRLEAKTDYKARLALLKSEQPRLVVRKTNRYVVAQIAVSEIAQDKILMGVSSKTLISKGWPEKMSGSLKSLPAAYLTGFALGKMAKAKIKSAILDMGMNRNVKKSRIFAVLKGALDAGLEIPHSKDSLPTDSDLEKNPEVQKIFNKIKQSI